MGQHGRRMTKDWSGISTAVAAFTGNATILAGFTPMLESGTILRMIGEYIVIPRATVADADVASISVGIGLVSTDAAAVGSSAMPDPASDLEYPWLYWGSHGFEFNSATLADQSGLAAISVRKSFDVRSMRKFRAGQAIAVVVEYANVAGNPPLEFVGGVTRILRGT